MLNAKDPERKVYCEILEYSLRSFAPLMAIHGLSSNTFRLLKRIRSSKFRKVQEHMKEPRRLG